jgi:hypothetical protein
LWVIVAQGMSLIRLRSGSFGVDATQASHLTDPDAETGKSPTVY